MSHIHCQQRAFCKDCKGTEICDHNRQRSICRECKGSQICEHNKRKSRCKDCKGSEICEQTAKAVKFVSITNKSQDVGNAKANM